MSGEGNENVPLEGGLTPNQIEQLKRSSNAQNVYLVTVKTADEKELFFWFKKIDMTVLSAASKFIESDPLRAGTIIFENTLIKGDKSYVNDVDVFPTVCAQLMKTMETATATLKKF